MKKFLLVLVFAVGFVIKASAVFGAETATVTKAPAEKSIKTQEQSTTQLQPKVSQPQLEKTEEATELNDRSSEMKIQNNITFGQVTNPGERGAVNNGNAVASTAEVKQSSSTNTVGISLIPMGGGTIYQGQWSGHIRNNYTLAVALELSIIPLLSLEAEVGQGRYYISYSDYGHSFTQYTYGGSAKFYLTRGLVQTYLGGGILGISYQNMTYGVNSMTTYDQTVGAGQAIAGAEIALSNNVAIGGRGSYIVPLFNRPQVLSGGGYAYPAYEDSSAMDTAMFRLMGTLRISL